MADTLEILVSRVALRDQSAFRDLYDRTAAKLFGVCLRVLQARNEAEDALQDCYIKIWRNAASFQASGHSPMSWLIAVARNSAIDRLRQRTPDASPLEFAEEQADAAPGPERAAIAADSNRRLQDCLRRLDQARAKAITGAYVEGYSYQELADRHGIPLNTMRTWLRRGLATLRECLSR